LGDGILNLTLNSLISKAATKLQSEAPLFTYLITELAQNRHELDNSYKRQQNNGYVVMIASILLLKFARNSPNSFARMLGLYLQGSGIKRRVIAVLHSLGPLGVIEDYSALDELKKAISSRSEVTVFLVDETLLNH
jgi:hypothetical protein